MQSVRTLATKLENLNCISNLHSSRRELSPDFYFLTYAYVPWILYPQRNKNKYKKDLSGWEYQSQSLVFLSVLSEVGSHYVVYSENIKIDLHFTVSLFSITGKKAMKAGTNVKRWLVTGHVGTCSSGSLKLGGAQLSGRKSNETHYLWQDIDWMWSIKKKRGHRKCLYFQLLHLLLFNGD